MGGYDDTPADMARDNIVFAKENLINMVGGCCGSTPDHIQAIAESMKEYPPRPFPSHKEPFMWLSGLEDLVVSKERFQFLNLGERCNVAGSAIFKKLIMAGDYVKAMDIAKKQVTMQSVREEAGRGKKEECWRDYEGCDVCLNQVEDGAMVLDVNVDDGMLDGIQAMQKFLKIAVTEPEVTKVS